MRQMGVNSRAERFRLALNMLAEHEQAQVLACIELELPEPNGGRRRTRGHNHLLHKPNRRCKGCRLEVLGNVAADLGRLDVVVVLKL